MITKAPKFYCIFEKTYLIASASNYCYERVYIAHLFLSHRNLQKNTSSWSVQLISTGWDNQVQNNPKQRKPSQSILTGFMDCCQGYVLRCAYGQDFFPKSYVGLATCFVSLPCQGYSANRKPSLQLFYIGLYFLASQIHWDELTGVCLQMFLEHYFCGHRKGRDCLIVITAITYADALYMLLNKNLIGDNVDDGQHHQKAN